MGKSGLNSIFLPDEQSSVRFGAQLIAAVVKNLPIDRALQINLSGPLGAGKTTLARAMLQAAGIEGQIRSPTYTLVESYETPDVQFVHIDLYRIAGRADAEGLGLREYDQPGTIWLVEWPERAGLNTQVDLVLELSYHAAGRQLRISSQTPFGSRITDAMTRD